MYLLTRLRRLGVQERFPDVLTKFGKHCVFHYPAHLGKQRERTYRNKSFTHKKRAHADRTCDSGGESDDPMTRTPSVPGPYLLRSLTRATEDQTTARTTDSRLRSLTKATEGLWQKFQNTGRVVEVPRQTRRKVTMVYQDAQMIANHIENRYRTPAGTARATIGTHGRPVSSKTVVKRLCAQ
ncbi:hypothetical protein DPMN_140626 [Dreissena polymorpha]|uniref:Transposase Tc1-like domain-containing protein n=1 Tax=Dreissena polymorpha TaxID=45954 RepID=A0A9D4G8H1_DREPO|nr:hypothetical protein DPMN_140626 [Dreissena polymorpha]